MAGSRAVAVVDNDEWRRRGLVDGIRELNELQVARACGRDEAGQLRSAELEVVLVAAESIAPGAWDRLVGLRTAGDVRRFLDRTATVVVLADDLSNPLLPVRAAEAGVDYLYARSDVSDLVALQTALTAPSPQRRPAELIDFERIRSLGVSFSSQLSEGLIMIEHRGLTGLFDDPPSVHLTRRRSITLRRALARAMAVRAAGPVSAARNQSHCPTWHQLRQVVDIARGAHGSYSP